MCALVVLGLVFSMPSQEIGLGEHSWNYLLCVERDVKWQLNQSVNCLVFGCFRAQKRNTWPQRHWSWSPGGSTRNFWCGSSDTRSRPSSRKTLNRHDTVCFVVGVGQSKKLWAHLLLWVKKGRGVNFRLDLWSGPDHFEVCLVHQSNTLLDPSKFLQSEDASSKNIF